MIFLNNFWCVFASFLMGAGFGGSIVALWLTSEVVDINKKEKPKKKKIKKEDKKT